VALRVLQFRKMRSLRFCGISFCRKEPVQKSGNRPDQCASNRSIVENHEQPKTTPLAQTLLSWIQCQRAFESLSQGGFDQKNIR
jgi:hypothetical protein